MTADIERCVPIGCVLNGQLFSVKWGLEMRTAVYQSTVMRQRGRKAVPTNRGRVQLLYLI